MGIKSYRKSQAGIVIEIVTDEVWDENNSLKYLFTEKNAGDQPSKLKEFAWLAKHMDGRNSRQILAEIFHR